MPKPASSEGAAAPGLSSGVVLQTGAGSPVGLVTPSQRGALYQDTTYGALYVAIGATSAGWVACGGMGTVNGVATKAAQGTLDGTDTALYLISGAGLAVTITDGIDTLSTGTGNSINWNFSELPDGSQDLWIFLGSTGQYRHHFDADGSFTVARGIKTGRQTSGALPTVALTSGLSRQIDAISDRETVTPFTGDGTNNAATCLIQLSPDDVTYATLATISIAAALNLTGVLTDTVNLRVPAAWYIKLTATHGTLGTTTYY